MLSSRVVVEVVMALMEVMEMVLALVRAVNGYGRACGQQAEGEADAR